MTDESQYPPHCRMMRDALKRKDWQQDAFALVMGRSRSTANGFLTGRQRLTARDAVDSGFALDLSPQVLLREQDAWVLSLLPCNQKATEAIRRRAETLTARLAKDAPREIAALEKERAAIDARIAWLEVNSVALALREARSTVVA